MGKSLSDKKPDGTVFAANPAYFHLYGFPQEEVIGKHFSIIFPEEERKAAYELYDYFFQSPTLGPPFVGPIRRADGEVLWKRIQGEVLYDEAGKPIRMIGISMDVPQ